MAGPLEGIKVVDLTRFSVAPGPFCTMMLGDFGADVLLVEQPPAREGAARPGDASSEARLQDAFDNLGRNKRSIALNLKHPEAQQILQALCRDADVFMEGYRPGVTSRLGCDYATISALNPRIVYCSISGYGQDGPYKGLVGHDVNYISTGGALGMTGPKGGPPAMPQNIIGDFAGGGLMAAASILMALIGREKTGRGQYIDISMTDGVAYLLASMAGPYFRNGTEPRGGATVVSGAVPHYNTYECQDGKYISLGCLEPHFWESLCRALAREDLIPHQNNVAMHPQIFEAFRAIFKTRPRDEWFDYLLNYGNVAVSKVHSLGEIFEDAQMKYRRMVVELAGPGGQPVKQVGIGPKLSDTPGTVRSLAPSAGQHTDQVLQGLGYSKAAATKMREQGIVG